MTQVLSQEERLTRERQYPKEVHRRQLAPNNTEHDRIMKNTRNFRSFLTQNPSRRP